MMITSFDAKRLINFTLHVGEPLTDAEVDGVVGSLDRMRELLAANPEASATTVVVVEAESGPNAKQRKRIGEAAKRLDRHVEVLVTHSAMVRAVMTAIRWFTPEDANKRHGTFASYADARTWLIAQTGHAGDVFDAMLADVRARAGSAASAAGR